MIRQQVLEANVELARRGLAPFTFGNASGIDRESGVVVIKPSGVPYAELTPEHMVAVSLDTGQAIDSRFRPSSDTLTHLELYRAFDSIGGVVHAHSHYATVWAQAGREIPCFGTTHADHFHGPVPVVGHLSDDEVESDYEANTGHAIVRRFMELDHRNVPAALLAGHAPFCWGPTVADALDTMTVLEEVARLAYDTVVLNAAASPIPDGLRDKHFFRKHGPGAYYGQPR